MMVRVSMYCTLGSGGPAETRPKAQNVDMDVDVEEGSVMSSDGEAGAEIAAKVKAGLCCMEVRQTNASAPGNMPRWDVIVVDLPQLLLLTLQLLWPSRAVDPVRLIGGGLSSHVLSRV